MGAHLDFRIGGYTLYHWPGRGQAPTGVTHPNENFACWVHPNAPQCYFQVIGVHPNEKFEFCFIGVHPNENLGGQCLL